MQYQSNRPPFQYKVKVQFLELCGEQILDIIDTDNKTTSCTKSHKHAKDNLVDTSRNNITKHGNANRKNNITCLTIRDVKAG